MPKPHRIAIWLAVGWLLLLGACSSIPKPTPPSPLHGHTGGCSAQVDISSPSLQAQAIVTRTPQACTVTYQAPPSLEGMTFIFGDGSVDVTYLGMTFEFERSSVPGNAPARILADALSAALSDTDIQVSEDRSELRGLLAAGEFTLTLDENAAPVKILVPADELEITMENFLFQD